MSYLKIYFDEAKYPYFELVDLPEESLAWLKSVYDQLNCDMIETVPTLFRDLILVVDETGKCYDNWEARINWIASKIYGSNYDVIVGDALLCRRYGSYIVGLTDTDINMIERIFDTTIKRD